MINKNEPSTLVAVIKSDNYIKDQGEWQHLETPQKTLVTTLQAKTRKQAFQTYRELSSKAWQANTNRLELVRANHNKRRRHELLQFVKLSVTNEAIQAVKGLNYLGTFSITNKDGSINQQQQKSMWLVFTKPTDNTQVKLRVPKSQISIVESLLGIYE